MTFVGKLLQWFSVHMSVICKELYSGGLVDIYYFHEGGKQVMFYID
jgi:hypothetical protein